MTSPLSRLKEAYDILWRVNSLTRLTCLFFSLFFRFEIVYHQEPITLSFHFPFLTPESTLSRIFLFWEAPPTGFFASVCIIANHKRAVVLHCLRNIQTTQKYFNYADVSVFSREIKDPPPPTYLSSKNKNIRDRVDSRLHLVWRLRVMGSWYHLPLPLADWSIEDWW